MITYHSDFEHSILANPSEIETQISFESHGLGISKNLFKYQI